MGRRLAFNLTLLIAAVFGIAAGGGPNFVGTASMVACIGLGTGGNLPVDGAIFLEFIPGTHQYLLTMYLFSFFWLISRLSFWWCIGQVVASVVAWGLIGNYSCADASDCPRSSNMGWRYTFFTLGGITLLMVFQIPFLCLNCSSSDVSLYSIFLNPPSISSVKAANMKPSKWSKQ
jgi:hypothetical protein